MPAEVATALDWATLRAEKDSFLDPALAQHLADLLYAVDLRGGGMGYVHVLFEHKGYVEVRINLDLLDYRVRIWQQWLNAGNTGPLPVTLGKLMMTIAEQWVQKAVRRAVRRAYFPNGSCCCGWC